MVSRFLSRDNYFFAPPPADDSRDVSAEAILSAIEDTETRVLRQVTPSRRAPSVHSVSEPVQGAPKVVFVGEMGVGKSSIIRRVTTGEFEVGEKTTIGVACLYLSMDLPDGNRRTLQLWDTAGQERFRALTRTFYRGASAALVVFALNERVSFDALDAWLRSVRAEDPHARFVLVGNKADLLPRRVDPEEARTLAQEWGAVYRECSAATGEGVDELFLWLGAALLPAEASGSGRGVPLAAADEGAPRRDGRGPCAGCG